MTVEVSEFVKLIAKFHIQKCPQTLKTLITHPKRGVEEIIENIDRNSPEWIEEMIGTQMGPVFNKESESSRTSTNMAIGSTGFSTEIEESTLSF